MTNKLEDIAVKAVGGIKAAKATIEGFEGVFRHLMREHAEVSALMLRVKLSADPDVRRELWPKIRRELLAHEQGEIQEVYPALRHAAETRSMATEHDQNAEELEQTIDELTAIAVDSAQWQPAFERLIELVQEHVRDEEEEYFPIADRLFRERSYDMLARYEEAKAEALRELNSTP